jgi:hypothetical protein
MTNIIITFLIVLTTIVTAYLILENHNKILFKDIITIVYSSSIIFILLNYVNTNIEENDTNYVKYVNQIFLNFDKIFLEYSDELINLYNEIYDNNTSNTPISPTEFIVLNLIINDINNIYHINPQFLNDIYIKNKLMVFSKSNKFKIVFSKNKNRFSPEFIELLKSEKIVTI